MYDDQWLDHSDRHDDSECIYIMLSDADTSELCKWNNQENSQQHKWHDHYIWLGDCDRNVDF